MPSMTIYKTETIILAWFYQQDRIFYRKTVSGVSDTLASSLPSAVCRLKPMIDHLTRQHSP